MAPRTGQSGAGITPRRAFCGLRTPPPEHTRPPLTGEFFGSLQIQRRRKDLRIIISSATLDAEAFRSFFQGASQTLSHSSSDHNGLNFTNFPPHGFQVHIRTLKSELSSNNCSKPHGKLMSKLFSFMKRFRHTLDTEAVSSCFRGAHHYMGTSLIRKNPLVGPYSSPLPRDLWWS